MDTADYDDWLTATYNLVGLDRSSLVPTGMTYHNQASTNPSSPIDAKLAPLDYYGGPTQTQIPESGSPVLGAGSTSNASGLSTDQRGFARVVAGSVDIGAFQTQGIDPEVTLATDDDGSQTTGDLTLRDAVNIAIHNGSENQVTFSPDLIGETIELDSPIIVTGYPNNDNISGEITITGPGANQLTISGGGDSDSIFQFGEDPNAFTCLIEGVTLTGATDHAIDIENAGYQTVKLDQVEISDNSGSAIYVDDVTALIVTNSTIANNGSSSSSPAVYVTSASSAKFVNDTISNNESSGSVAGVQISGGTVATIQSTTIAENHADTDTSGYGAGLTSGLGVTTLLDSIVLGNTADTSQSDTGNAIASSGAFTSSSAYNLIGVDNSISSLGSKTGTIVYVVTNPSTPLSDVLEPLGDYGGTTETRALPTGSDAIDAGDNVHYGNSSYGYVNSTDFAAEYSYDQRGNPRVVNSRIDIGAVESNPVDETPSGGGGPTYNEELLYESYEDGAVDRAVDSQDETNRTAINASGARVTAWVEFDDTIWVVPSTTAYSGSSPGASDGFEVEEGFGQLIGVGIASDGTFDVAWTEGGTSYVTLYSADGSTSTTKTLPIGNTMLAFSENSSGAFTVLWMSGNNYMVRVSIRMGLRCTVLN